MSINLTHSLLRQVSFSGHLASYLLCIQASGKQAGSDQHRGISLLKFLQGINILIVRMLYKDSSCYMPPPQLHLSATNVDAAAA